jgi:dihydroorotate dehydrogenase
MKLRGIDFGSIFGASGVEGFFGEGYWFHPVFRPLGLDFSGMTFVSKTSTYSPRVGNVSLTKHYTLRNPFPSCIRAKPFRGSMLNAVGLSNPGLLALLETQKWQKKTTPFWISLMSVADTPARRLEEWRRMVALIGEYKSQFSVSFGLQANLSCPNSDEDPAELIGESAEVLEILSELGVPVMPKYSIATAPIEAILELDKHPHCDGICVSNTIPFGSPDVDWQEAWGSKVSPIANFGGGGLSGETLRPLVCRWIMQLRDAGFTKPINGGGGIMHAKHVEEYQRAGASSVFIGTVASLRPWRVRSIIERANNLEWRQ